MVNLAMRTSRAYRPAPGARRTTVDGCGDPGRDDLARRVPTAHADAGRRAGSQPHLERRRAASQAPGARLPVHLLLPAPGGAAPLAPGVRRRARGRGGVRRAEGLRRSRASRRPASSARRRARVQRPLLASVRGLLAATAGRTPTLGCFGLHEWAMVYRHADETRHDWPLRLGRAGTDEVVESHRIACSHFDAFRFFTDTARPLNTLSAGPRRPAGVRAAGLPARRDGPLQARLPAHPADRLRAGRRLLRAGLGHPRARHARLAVRLRRRWASSRCAIETAGGQAGVRRRAARLRRARRAAAGPADRGVRPAADAPPTNRLAERTHRRA